jgi:hypothetical protein
MNNILKTILAGLIFLCLFIFFIPSLQAQTQCDPDTWRTPDGRVCIPSPLQTTNLAELIERIVLIIFWLGIILVPLLVILGAFYITVSGGDPQKLSLGKKMIIYALIGLVFILMVRAIVSLTFAVLGLR